MLRLSNLQTIAVSVTAKAAAESLLASSALEPVATRQARPENYALHVGSRKVHCTVTAFPLANHRLDDTGKNPGAHYPRRHGVELDDLIDCQ